MHKKHQEVYSSVRRTFGMHKKYQEVYSSVRTFVCTRSTKNYIVQ